jgi:hypothetical protein
LKKLVILLLLVGAFCCLVLNAAAQTIKPDNLPVLGISERVAYVDLAKLTGGGKPDVSVRKSYLTMLKPESFFQKFSGGASDCWSKSVLRAGIVAYCFPHLMMGQHFTNQLDSERKFFPVGNYPGVYIWYESEKNIYYLWSSQSNSSYVIGPFPGEPLAALTNAVIPTKEKRSFPDVKIEVVSQRWTYPDEPEPTSRTSRSDMGRCDICEEMQKYESLTSRLRIENNGQTNVYFLARKYGLAPEGVVLTKFKDQTEFNRRFFPFRFPVMGGPTTWIPLPPATAIEFEIKFQSVEQASYQFLMILNDEPQYWDEVETPVPVQTMVRERKLSRDFKLLKKSN